MGTGPAVVTMEETMAEPDGTAKAPYGGRWRIVSAGLALLLVAAVVGCVLLWRDRDDLADLEGRTDAERAATEQAEQVVVAWLTYDYRDDPDDQTWVTENGTDAFQAQYEQDALNQARQEIVGDREFVSRGRVVNSAATVEDEDHVTVLVFTDQAVTDKDIRREGGEALHARSGVELSMVREDGEWLVDELVQLQFQ